MHSLQSGLVANGYFALSMQRGRGLQPSANGVRMSGKQWFSFMIGYFLGVIVGVLVLHFFHA